MKRRPYQMRAVATILGKSTAPRMLPPGGGKTQTIADFLAKYPHEHVVFVTHTNGRPLPHPSIVYDEAHHVVVTAKKKRTGKDGR